MSGGKKVAVKTSSPLLPVLGNFNPSDKKSESASDTPKKEVTAQMLTKIFTSVVTVVLLIKWLIVLLKSEVACFDESICRSP